MRSYSQRVFNNASLMQKVRCKRLKKAGKESYIVRRVSSKSFSASGYVCGKHRNTQPFHPYIPPNMLPKFDTTILRQSLIR